MRLLRAALTLICCVTVLNLLGQRTLTGRILDGQTQKPIEQATVAVDGTAEQTKTNVLGFFQLSINGSKTLVISRMGYKTSTLEIPAGDQFKVFLERKYTLLSNLDLAINLYKKLPRPSQPELNVAANASSGVGYPGGVKYFQNDLIKILRHDEYKGLFADSVSIRFAVTAKGNVAELTIGQGANTQRDSIVRSAFDSLNTWTPAVEAGVRVPDFFRLNLFWSDRNPENDEAIIEVDEPATYATGMESLYRHIASVIHYPPEARRNGIQGKVYVELVIEKDGLVSNVEVTRRLGAGCDEEAIKAITTAPSRWAPGKKDGRVVRQRIALPITFQLFYSKSYGHEYYDTYLYNTLRYSSEAFLLGLEGWVVVKISVDNQSNVMSATVLSDIGGGNGEGVVKSIQSMPLETVKTMGINGRSAILPIWFAFDETSPRSPIPEAPGDATEVLSPIFISVTPHEVFSSIEEPAKPVNGMAAFYKQIYKDFKYPGDAHKKGQEGKVFVEFVVEKDGTLTHLRVVDGVGDPCDDAVLQALRKASPWVPGHQRGNPVKQRMVLPIICKP